MKLAVLAFILGFILAIVQFMAIPWLLKLEHEFFNALGTFLQIIIVFHVLEIIKILIRYKKL